jgi:hypothetical protein
MMSHGYKQNEISQELSMGTKIFKTSYYTVLRAFSFNSFDPEFFLMTTSWWPELIK